jgi:hypothetical protein
MLSLLARAIRDLVLHSDSELRYVKVFKYRIQRHKLGYNTEMMMVARNGKFFL